MTDQVPAIRSEADYAAALARIWSLMHAESGPEGRELDLLADAVMDYEERQAWSAGSQLKERSVSLITFRIEVDPETNSLRSVKVNERWEYEGQQRRNTITLTANDLDRLLAELELQLQPRQEELGAC
jgi:hypothetical protein